jgi:two-component system nitrogen regulation response regulator GlnG
MSTVLIVDDEPSICWALERALTDEGHEVTSAASAEEALEFVEEATPDVVVMDVRLPGLDGLSALQKLRSRIATTPVIVITAFGSLDTAVQAISRGAFEYLTKPFDLDEAIAVIRRALDERCSAGPHSVVPVGDSGSAQLLGTSPAMQAVFRKIAIVAEHDVPVLITGESGTGKELVAHAIHRYSRRSEGPFVPVCVPAMSEQLVESELFGHARGAFTGAALERQGLLKDADHGTAFLDEIGDISIPLQVKLLRVLETRTITPVGTNQPLGTNFRLVAATNRNLDQMLSAGSFRDDLYYRLNVFRIELPPLRERKEDIALLANYFARRFSPDGRLALSEAAVDELYRRPWHGNVRELRNSVEHAIIVTRGAEVRPESFPSPISRDPAAGPAAEHLPAVVRHWWRMAAALSASGGEATGLYDRLLSEVEPILFREALQQTGGNVSEAARILGIHRQTLREKLRRYEDEARAASGS